MQSCNPVNEDCACKDITYEFCKEPTANQELHVNSIKDCIDNCDLFANFGQCDYLLYYGDNGKDENCQLISGENGETIERYLESCRIVGQPLRDSFDNCISGFATNGCSQQNCGNSQCHTCTKDGPCKLYSETECTINNSPGETVDGIIPSIDVCLTFCTKSQAYSPWTYFTYDKEAQKCICYNGAEHSCGIKVVPQGLSYEDIMNCGEGCKTDGDCTDPMKPICDNLSGICVQCIDDPDCPGTQCINHVCGDCSCDIDCLPNGDCPECNSDDDCKDPSKPQCDLETHLCKNVCHQHSDCEPSDFCKCHECNEGSNDDCSSFEGKCELGCREPTKPCTLEDGSIGECDGCNKCQEITGVSKLNRLIIETKTCEDGCSDGDEGATFEITETLPGGEQKSCVTPILNKPGEWDYDTGKETEFNIEDFGSCRGFPLSDPPNDFKVTWNGSGKWTPEKFTLDRGGSVCKFECPGNGVELSKGASASFVCATNCS